MNTRLASTILAAILLGLGGGVACGQSKSAASTTKDAGGKAAKSAKTAKDLTLDDLFPRDRVLDVRITVDDADWDKIRRQRRTFFTALQPKRRLAPVEPPYTYVSAKVVIDGVVFPKVGLRKKGFIGSQSTTSPSLKIKLNHVDKKAGVEGLTNLTFNNNRQDPALVSQFMGYAIFNAAGSPAPRCAYAKIQVNGKVIGIYSHVESVRRQLIKRGFGTSKGTLYEGTAVDFVQGWEGSFDKEFGPDKPGRKKIVQLIDALRGGDRKALVGAKANGRGWVPTNADLDGKWTAAGFDDSEWKQGRNGAGFEADSGFESLISKPFNFKAEMYRKSASVYLRFPFEVGDPGQLASGSKLVLSMKYDDGFVAYLNGHRVAAANAPTAPQWDSTATGGHADSTAMTFQPFDISAHRDKLRKGKNVLAIHGLNLSAASGDMLIVAELQVDDYDYEAAIGKLVDLDAFYRFWAVEGLLGFWDGYSGNANNFFVYLNPKTDKFYFLPWGADSLFVKRGMLQRNRKAPVSVKTKGMVAHKLYQTASGRKRYAKAMQGILKEHWDEKALLAEVDRIEKMLAPHVGRRLSRFERALDRVRTFIRTRRADVEEEMAGGMPIWTQRPRPPFVMDRNSRRRRR